MRVEYSAVTAKAMGFSYAYPLLYPKLVEFFFRLPLQQKRRDGLGRYLIRQYLSQYAPEEVHGKLKKTGGIFSSTLHLCKERYNQGKFDKYFLDLPFQNRLKPNALSSYQLIAKINGYMLQKVFP